LIGLFSLFGLLVALLFGSICFIGLLVGFSGYFVTNQTNQT